MRAWTLVISGLAAFAAAAASAQPLPATSLPANVTSCTFGAIISRPSTGAQP